MGDKMTKMESIHKNNKYIILVLMAIMIFLPIDITIKLSGLIIVIATIVYNKFSEKDSLQPIALYSLSWLGGIGLANLKLSYHQITWGTKVWVVLISSYFIFIFGYFIYNRYFGQKISKVRWELDNERLYKNMAYYCILCIIIFLIEAIILGYIPLFSTEMGAYMDFHIKGLHYFTVSIIIVPIISLIYKNQNGKKKVYLWIILSIAIPIVIVSRQLLILAVFLILITIHQLYIKLSKKTLIIVSSLLLIMFVLSSYVRHQDLEYIHEVANMKYKDPSILTQPYMYVVMNFENMANIIEKVEKFELGKNTFFPIFAFTNMKYYFDYAIKSELLISPYFTTTTYLSNLFYDFGVFGIVVFNFLFGFLAAHINKIVKNNKIHLFSFGILCFTLLFSFFEPWYSNPSLWFDIVIFYIIMYASSKRINIKNKIKG